MKKVEILMSTYNGEKYIKQQIDSILTQREVEVRLLVRDDGSHDGTQLVLETYQREGKLRWVQGNNVRPAQSFLQLLSLADDDVDFYAFADQDDVWLEDKLIAAIRLLEEEETTPALYYSQTLPVDEQLRPLPIQKLRPFLTFGEALIYHHCGGNTMVFNRSLRRILLGHNPFYYPMHDVYILLVAQAVGGKVVFDTRSHLLYRQHNNNVVGQRSGFWSEWKRRFRFVRDKQEIRSRLAQDVLIGYADYIPPKQLTLLRKFVEGKRSWKARFQLFFHPSLHCGSISVDCYFRLALLFNTY